MVRPLLATFWMAVFVCFLGTVGGCGGNEPPAAPVVQDKEPADAPKPLPPPNIGGGTTKPGAGVQ